MAPHLMEDPSFSPGFRFSVLDGIVLTIGTVATIGFAMINFWIGIAIGFVVLHFFLFCNILRMSRSLELLWAGIFTVLAILTMAELIIWPLAFTLSVLVTLFVAMIEARRPSYHGVAWRTLNPNLPEWWQAHTSGT